MGGITTVVPASLPRAWRKALAANYTGSFPTIDPDLAAAQAGGRPTMASGRALVDFGNRAAPSELHIVPIGAGDADQTVKLRVWGYRACTGGFIGTLLWAGTATLCDTTGSAGFDAIATDRFADAVTTTVGTEGVDCRTTSPGSELPGKVKILTGGCEILVIDFDKDTATNVNALYAGE